ncbi:type III pantothenate kinase [Spiroplasma endosymbiont of Labia minor]|uniref:type III pantothenate kinase n=1 Tax=Spiroplasma endosymbiont of Labia minor TaxID=3066305 RepID=UPI0030CFE6C9
MKIFIDIGNSTVDIRFYAKNKFEPLLRFATNDYFFSVNVLYNKLKSLNIEEIIYSSVVPNWDIKLIDLKNELKCNLINIKNLNLDIGSELKNSYKEIGADFVANLFAIKKIKPNKVVLLISLGTATTLMLINNSKIISIIIAPGVEISLKSLLANTSLPSDFNIKYESNLYNLTTKKAVSTGIINGHWNMLESFVNLFKKDFEDLIVVCTGGNWWRFNELLKNANYELIEDLIFIGLKYITK